VQSEDCYQDGPRLSLEPVDPIVQLNNLTVELTYEKNITLFIFILIQPLISEKMKKLSYLIMLIFLAGFSCQEEAEEPTFAACGVQNPINELTWLNERTEQPWEYLYITQAEYTGETIFMMKNCCPYCNTVITAYNCEGTLLGVVGQGSEIDASLILNEKTIWKPANSPCFS